MTAEFWSMGGYAVYVWGSYAAGLAVLVWNLVAPKLRDRDVRRRVRAAGRGDA